MKRILLLYVVMVLGCVAPFTASAQFDLGKALGGLLGAAATPQPTVSPYDEIRDNAPARSKILGTWQYKTASLEYLGSNALAAVALKQLEGFGLSELKNRGIVEGCCSLTLRRNGLAVLSTLDTLHDSNYTYNEDSAAVEVTSVVEGVTHRVKGFIRIVSDNLVVMIDGNDVLALLEKESPEITTDQTYLTAKGLLQSLGDVYLTTIFCR